MAHDAGLSAVLASALATSLGNLPVWKADAVDVNTMVTARCSGAVVF